MKYLIRKYKISKILNKPLENIEEKRVIDFLDKMFPKPLVFNKCVKIDENYSYVYDTETNFFWIDQFNIKDIFVKKFKIDDTTYLIIKDFIEYKFGIKLDNVYDCCLLTLIINNKNFSIHRHKKK